jgi:hypothetical protein
MGLKMIIDVISGFGAYAQTLINFRGIMDIGSGNLSLLNNENIQNLIVFAIAYNFTSSTFKSFVVTVCFGVLRKYVPQPEKTRLMANDSHTAPI